jgi:hypothetical protein
VHVFRRGASRPFSTRAARVAYEPDLYTLTEPARFGLSVGAGFIDGMWMPVESRLPPALDALVGSTSSPLDAHIWANTLVPFITDLFVRGRDFIEEFQLRWIMMYRKDVPRELFGETGARDNANMARLMERQRLLAPVMSAEWEVVHNDSSVPVITNDLGYTLVHDYILGRVGYAVPLRSDAVLTLWRGPRARGLGLGWTGDGWVVLGIRHARMTDDGVRDLNRAIAWYSTDEVYGSDPVVVEKACDSRGSHPPVRPQGMLLVDPGVRLDETEMVYFKVLTVLGERGTPSTPILFPR